VLVIPTMNDLRASRSDADARDGRRVLVITRDGTAARLAFDEICRLTHGADRIIRANGGERIEHRNGGRVLFATPRSTGHRGVSVDTIYVDAGADPLLDEGRWTDLLPCIAASRDGEVIRA
jgi:hypothetical protein